MTLIRVVASKCTGITLRNDVGLSTPHYPLLSRYYPSFDYVTSPCSSLTSVIEIEAMLKRSACKDVAEG